MDLAATLPTLYLWAWLLPLASFVAIVLFGPRMGKHGVGAAYVATAAIVTSFIISLAALISWGLHHHEYPGGNSAAVAAHESGSEHKTEGATKGEGHETAEHGAKSEAAGRDGEYKIPLKGHANPPPLSFAKEWYPLAVFGKLRITISYYIDALTVAMFAMITLIASCIHFYAIGYMHDELHEVVDHEVVLRDGHHLHRPGRYYRFFQYLSLFCFSMLGLVIAGNIAMVFVFWELVGICSYFLIGFYIERTSASNAANKAFIVNRIGDFGMIIGLMALWGALGTFNFADQPAGPDGAPSPGLFTLVRPESNEHQLQVPDGMVRSAAVADIQKIIVKNNGDMAAADAEITSQMKTWRDQGFGHWLLVIAGLGIFCGCVGKSAQFPLHVWLPDAMEGPTPVSALVHSATMVAAGVYLVGRFFPVFTSEVLLTIAYVGCITLFIAATIAITATDIKRVLAYSTVSQLGYMMLALGVGGWLAGMLHLITHAFFKSLLFMCSGSVIHATHTNDMMQMGGLRRKMPWTAYTMLIGCMAIMGVGIPFVGGFSGYHSKDSIIEQLLSFKNQNPNHAILFYTAIVGAAITAFYMFRLWYLTFSGEPRDHHIYDHAHESPKVMYIPLVILSVFAIGVAWPFFWGGGVSGLLEQARPAGTGLTVYTSPLIPNLVHPHEHFSHNDHIRNPATIVASCMGVLGFLIATAFYGVRYFDPKRVARSLSPIYNFLLHKWYFDELYWALFVQPVLVISNFIAAFDRIVIDGIVNGAASLVRHTSTLDNAIDTYLVDGMVNWTATIVYGVGHSLKRLQTGRLRQYVMFIVVGTVALFIIASFFWSSPSLLAGLGMGE